MNSHKCTVVFSVLLAGVLALTSISAMADPFARFSLQQGGVTAQMHMHHNSGL